MAPSSAESGVIRNYVETIVSLPWNKSSKTISDINKAERILNEDTTAWARSRTGYSNIWR